MKAPLMSWILVLAWIAFSPLVAVAATNEDVFAWSNVFKPAGDKVKVAYFTGDFCIPCKAIKPMSDGLKRQGVPVLVVDYDKHAAFRTSKGVNVVPVVIIFDGDNREVKRLVGASEITKDSLYGFIRAARRR